MDQHIASKEQRKVNRSVMIICWDVEYCKCDGKRAKRIWGDSFSLLVFISLCLEHACPEPQMSTRCQLDVLCSQKESRNLENTSRAGTTTSRIRHTSWSIRITASDLTPVPNCKMVQMKGIDAPDKRCLVAIFFRLRLWEIFEERPDYSWMIYWPPST